MTSPTLLDFALIYPAPAPAGLAGAFDHLSLTDRLAALKEAHRLRSRAKEGHACQYDPLTFLQLKPWRANDD